MRRIVDYRRLTEMKRERKLVSRSFKRRNIEDNLLRANFLKYLGTCHSHTVLKPPSTKLLSTHPLSSNRGHQKQFQLQFQLQL
jgi:hypothetical protein